VEYAALYARVTEQKHVRDATNSLSAESEIAQKREK
jgi:hypothetical protein